jgi:radical SAM protein with 4Fe4S-binding SPASM domain
VDGTSKTALSLAVCILFYEKPEQTIECLESFLPSGVPIYVLNNGSSPAARKVLGDFCAGHQHVVIVDSEENLGVAVGRNRLISESREEWLFFVDNDITVKTQDWLARIARHMDRDSAAEVFIPELFNVHERRYVVPLTISIVQNKVRFSEVTEGTTNAFPGGAALISRHLFERLGLYDAQLFVGLEDFELAIRGIREGHPVKAKVARDIELVHDHRSITSDKDRSAVSARYDVNSIERSSRRIKEKHNVELKHGWSVRLWAITEDRRMTGRTLPLLARATNKALAARALLHSGQRWLLSLFDGKPRPWSCTLYMTNRCNLKCGSCLRQTRGIRTVGEMKLGTVQKMVSSYPSVDSYCIAGYGEPTLCDDFVAVVDFLKMKRKYVGIITNGTNLERLMELRSTPDYLSISLYGFDNESYTAYCGVPAFERVIANYETLRRRFGNVGFSYITNRETYLVLDRILRLCDDLRPQFVHLLNHLVYEANDEEETQKIITVRDTDIIGKIDELCAGRKYIALKPYYIDLEHPGMHCRSYDDVLNLDGEGNIGGCQRKIPPDIRFGNIFQDKDPFNSPEMTKLRKTVNSGCYAHDVCRSCFARWAR